MVHGQTRRSRAGQKIHPSAGVSVKKNIDELKIYHDLQQIINKYGSEFFLKQSMHPFSTQTNEALNQSQAALTPKNKVFHTTKAFHYRHSILVGTHNWGYRRFWEETFNEVGIKLSNTFCLFLQRVEDTRKRHKVTKTKQETKRKRKHNQEAVEKKLLDVQRTINIDYKSGIGLDIGYNNDPVPKKQISCVCKWCGSTTHKTKRSSQCPYNPTNIEKQKDVCDKNEQCVNNNVENIADV